MTNMRWWLVALVLSGCTIHPTYVRPRVAMPAGWHGTQALGNTQPAWPAHDWWRAFDRSEEHTSELQSRSDFVCRLLLEKKKKRNNLNSGNGRCIQLNARRKNS